ncbi:glycine oxidase ThiO [Kineococcus aurantiacus]
MPHDVVVLGGGVVGATCAWRLAEQGLHVLLVDPEPGAGASHAAAGMLAPVSEMHGSEPALLRLGLHAAGGFADHAARVQEASGLGVGYRPTGTLLVALDAGDRARLADVRRRQEQWGLQVERLSAAQCRQREPLLDPAVVAGTLVPGDHQVDPRRLVTAVLRAARERGVEFRRTTGEPAVTAGRVTGVRTPQGEVAAGRVVLATGARATAHAPVRPVKGQVLRLRGNGSPVPHHVVRGTVRDRAVYVVPREDGEVVVGATTEDLGYDTTVTAGAVRDLLQDACALVPALAELELAEAVARSRPGSPDNLPLIGAGDVEGLVLAVGHGRNGVLLSAVTAQAVTALVTGQDVPPPVAACAPGRFEELVRWRG